MKVSELIENLGKFIQEYGDKEIKLDYGESTDYGMEVSTVSPEWGRDFYYDSKRDALIVEGVS